MSRYLFTSESVTKGHPDKVCDQISDSILDAIIKEDPEARVACECAVNTGLVLIMGEITTSAYVDMQKIARKTICDIGYNSPEVGFDGNTCGVITSIDEQSGDIAMGVDKSLEAKTENTDDENGAGDQGIMFGYACTETEEYMPLPISLAHKLAIRLTDIREDGTLDYLRPDGKTQVTVEYEDDRPVRIDTIVISTQHDPDVSLETIRRDMIEQVIKPVVDEELLDENTRYLVNPTGRFVIGGPQGDSGLTGRKIIVDTYGGSARHGGGAFSGKDPTKVDRSASYMARYIAKNLVASGLCDRIEIELAYAIGVAKPVSVYVDTYGTSRVSDDRLVEIINENFDLRPAQIIRQLDLRRPIYQKTASYGHFGREDFPWEKLDKAETLKKYL